MPQIAVPYEGSALIGATEFSLPNNSTTRVPITEIGVFQLFIFIDALALGDQFDVKVWEKILATTPQRLLTVYHMGIESGMLVDAFAVRPDPPALSGPALVIPSVILGKGWDVTIQKATGIDRVVEWSLRAVQ